MIKLIKYYIFQIIFFIAIISLLYILFTSFVDEYDNKTMGIGDKLNGKLSRVSYAHKDTVIYYARSITNPKYVETVNDTITKVY